MLVIIYLTFAARDSKLKPFCTLPFSPPGLAITPHGGLTPWTPGHWASPNRMVMGLYPTAHLDFSTWFWFPAGAKGPGMGKMWAPPACTNVGGQGLGPYPCLPLRSGPHPGLDVKGLSLPTRRMVPPGAGPACPRHVGPTRHWSTQPR